MQHYLGPVAMDVARLCVWLVLLMIVFVPLERLCALHPQKVFRAAFGTDVIYFFLSSLLPKLLLILPLSLLAAAVHTIVPSAFYSYVGALPLSIRLPAALVVGELGAYWAHRWSHQSAFLWRFHAIHHSAEEVDFLVNTRAHPVDLVFTRFCDMVPMYFLGLAQPLNNTLDLVPVLVTLAGTMWGFFIHANVNWRLGWFEWVISSPAFHHWHHSVNKNYSPMLPWIDKCFGTYYLPQQWPEKYGIDPPIATHLTGQLLDPIIGAAPEETQSAGASS